MKRKQPILVLLVFGALALAGVVNFNHRKAALSDAESWSLREREGTLAGYLNVATELGKAKKWDELEGSLRYAQARHLIDFYALTVGNDVVWFAETDGDPQKIPMNVSLSEPLRTEGEAALVAGAIQVDDYKVTIGLHKNSTFRKAERAKREHAMFLEELIYFGLIVLIVGAWALKDILMIVRQVRSGKIGKDFSKVKTNSAESELFMRGLVGYADTVSMLQAENLKLGRQVLPSLKKEIMSGKKPPYDFDCTMVRTDINQFSLIYNTHNVTEFMATINEFFKQVSFCVARYNGLVHEFVGDEVIFYFKDEDHPNSFATALSAVRDIGQIAETFHRATMTERGYPFTVKSSLAHGKVRFGPLVNGFTVAGSVLIETVRILSYIHEKDENVVYFDARHTANLTSSISSAERMRVTLKGFQEEKALHQYLGHRELKEVFANLDASTVSDLSLYRTDHDLSLILEKLQSEARPHAVTLKAVQDLRQVYLPSPRAEFADQISSWVQRLVTATALSTDSELKTLLSAVMKLYLNFASAETFGSKHETQLQDLLLFSDKRVVANALEVLTHFDRHVDAKTVKQFKKDDLRVAANSLVHEAKDEITANVVKQIDQMMKSKDAATVASALYAVGEIAKTHRERDLVYYSTKSEFVAFVASLDTHVQHPNGMIRRQAFSAARKAGDDEVLARIHEVVRLADSDLLSEEASKHLGSAYPPKAA